jgi:hypothetical protein
MRRISWAIAAVLLLTAVALLAQRGGGRFRGGPPPGGETHTFPATGEMHFVRMEYTDRPEYSRGFGFVSRGGQAWGWWAQDWPDAEEHFTYGIQRLTRIDIAEPIHMRLTDDKIFDNPWIYGTQTGNMALTGSEIEKLREYLERGGFLVVDDMWGPYELDNFRQTMERVLPGRPIADILESDSVMHVLYDIKDKDRTFIPGSRHLRRGPGGGVQVMQPPGTEPAWRSITDEKDRMVVAINFNTDVGDAWEFADVPYYPEAMTTLAYRYGINYIIYSMTH